MKTIQLRKKQKLFLNDFKKESITVIEQKLKQFHLQFPVSEISAIDLNNYVYGRIGIDNIYTFCYWMEKELSDFGRISGSPCSQYGIWYGTHGIDKAVEYRHTKKYGNNLASSFAKIKSEISTLISLGARDDYKGIANCMIADKFKGKILTTYFPEKYLSIYADEYLNDILKYFNLDENDSFWETPIFKQLRLIAFKSSDEEMKNWPLTLFAMFINHEMSTYFYVKTPLRESKHRVPQFPDIANVTPITVSEKIDSTYKGTGGKNATPHYRKKIDYIKKSIRDKGIGDRGEQLVKIHEQNRLRTANRPDLADKVEWVSRQTDGQGFDILSFEADETQRQIEVKTTTRPFGKAKFFMTDFEMSLSKGLTNYYIYCVFDIMSTTPVIWPIKSPFNPTKKGIIISPIAYYIEILPKSTEI